MASERNYNAVPSVLLTANGSTEGVLQVTDTAGFYSEMQAILANSLGNTLTVYIKKIVNSTTLWVGPTKGGMDHNIDVSAFTVATMSSISAKEQPKQVASMETRLLSTYENSPVDAWRTKSVDSYGNGYTVANAFPTQVISPSLIPFSLISLTLPALINDLVSSLTYDQVTNTIVNGQEVLTFSLDGTVIQTVTLTQSGSGWVLNLGVLPLDFLLLENGSEIELENNSGAILLEV